MRAPRGSKEGSDEPLGLLGGPPGDCLFSPKGSKEEADVEGAASWGLLLDPFEDMSLISSREMRLTLFF